MWYKLALMVAVFAIIFLLFPSGTPQVSAYRSRYSNYYSYYSSYSAYSIGWYVWVLISGGIFATVLTIVCCIACCRRRRMNAAGNVIRYNGGVTTVTNASINNQVVYPGGMQAPQPVITGAMPPNPGYPTQQYPNGTQPYPTGTQPYPPMGGGLPPYQTDGKMYEPPPYAPDVGSPVPTITDNTSSPPSYGFVNQGADISSGNTGGGGMTSSNNTAPSNDM